MAAGPQVANNPVVGIAVFKFVMSGFNEFGIIHQFGHKPERQLIDYYVLAVDRIHYLLKSGPARNADIGRFTFGIYIGRIDNLVGVIRKTNE